MFSQVSALLGQPIITDYRYTREPTWDEAELFHQLSGAWPVCALPQPVVPQDKTTAPALSTAAAVAFGRAFVAAALAEETRRIEEVSSSGDHR